MTGTSTSVFFSNIPPFSRFETVTSNEHFRALPDDWILGLADVVSSRTAIEAGRYKDVNLAGVSSISAVLNAVDHRDLPFTFGGDGALIAVPGELESHARAALSAVQIWVEEELNLALRVATIPVSAIRRAGREVNLAKFSVSPFVSYAMFAGGGAKWAELEMKAGHFHLPRAAAGTRPNLAGLSCRWSPMPAMKGEILSLIVSPTSSASGHSFSALVTDILEITAELPRGGNPVAPDGPQSHVSLAGLSREIKIGAPPSMMRPMHSVPIVLDMASTLLSQRFGIGPRGRYADQYIRDIGNNSDFRKFDDGLKMTIDTDAAHRRRIEGKLIAARKSGIAFYGLHRQSSALVTCFVPAPSMRNHIHFIDGADGGYAVAASHLADAINVSGYNASLTQ